MRGSLSVFIISKSIIPVNPNYLSILTKPIITEADMEYTVHFIDENRRIRVPGGTTLLEARIRAALPADAPCGGKGTCGKCLCDFRPAGGSEWRRARMCQTPVEGDVEVRVLRSREKLRVLTEDAGLSPEAWDPLVRAVHVTVPPCARGDSTSDWTRLAAALADAGIPTGGANVNLCATLGALLARTKGEVWAVVGGDRVLEISEGEPQVYMAAFDLGTTSIAGYLIHVNGRRVCVNAGARNPQAQFGGDVISRADYALANGTDALSGCARKALNDMTGQMCDQAGVPRERVFAVSLAGNTAMHHLFLGISPHSLVKAPYNPTLSQPLILEAARYGFEINPEALLFMLPVIGGFVGADTVACLISGDWLRREKLTLMIDIGTNGELVLGNRHRRIACSTAAGPAFEGAKIACGMRGADGAIDHAWLEDGALRWHVIGDGPAKGICGSGLVDLTAALLQSGEMDESGRLEAGDRYDIGDTGVYLTQKDIREVQLAKGAMAAGLRLMAKALGVGVGDIEEVDIAGAFGNYIDPDSACAIGLIPPELRERIVPVGNAAGAGARLALIDSDAWREADTLARTTEFLELATLPEFQDEFVDQLGFGEEE